MQFVNNIPKKHGVEKVTYKIEKTLNECENPPYLSAALRRRGAQNNFIYIVDDPGAWPGIFDIASVHLWFTV